MLYYLERSHVEEFVVVGSLVVFQNNQVQSHCVVESLLIDNILYLVILACLGSGAYG